MIEREGLERALPAQARHGDRTGHRRRGAGPLAASRAAGWLPPDEFVPIAERTGLDRTADRLRASHARSAPVPALARGRARAVASPSTCPPAACSTPSWSTTSTGALDASGVRRRRSSSSRSPRRASCPTPSMRCRCPERPVGDGRHLGDRRLRHGLLVAVVPEATPGRRGQDRQVVRAQHARATRTTPSSSARSSTSPATSGSGSSPRASRHVATWDALRELGCDIAQGYLISRPMRFRRLRRWLHTNATGPFRLARRGPVRRARHHEFRRPRVDDGTTRLARLRPTTTSSLRRDRRRSETSSSTSTTVSPSSREECWRGMALFIGHWHLRGYGWWAVEDRRSGEFLGRIGLYNPEGWPGHRDRLAAPPRRLGRRARHRRRRRRRSPSRSTSSAPTTSSASSIRATPARSASPKSSASVTRRSYSKAVGTSRSTGSSRGGWVAPWPKPAVAVANLRSAPARTVPRRAVPTRPVPGRAVPR